MKFPKSSAYLKTMPGVEILEYCPENARFPIDCAVAKFRNGEYPKKIKALD